MKSKKYPLLACLLGMTLLHLNCSSPKDLEYRDFRNFGVTKLGISTSSVRMDLVYYNPNNFGLQLNRTDLDIYINDNYLGHTIQEFQITIPKREEFAIPIIIDVDMKNLWRNTFITTFYKEVTVKVTGSLKVGKANVFASFPVKYEGKQQFSILK
jgi:LEA14-like dessication related protein